jgi:DNA-binding transcriptional MerR regulator
MAGPGLGIAEAAAASGLTAHTLRYYERDGLLLGEIDRDLAGRRVYRPGDLSWIATVTRLRATGMAIRQIREYARLCRAGDGNEAERLALLLEHREQVLARLAEINVHLRAIDGKIAIYDAKVSQGSLSQ